MARDQLPYILASSSRTRQKILTNAQIPFECRSHRLDEDKVKREGPYTQPLAEILALLKAKSISHLYPTRKVIGSDQVLMCENIYLNRVQTYNEARAQLKKLSGKTHELVSSVVVVEADQVLFCCTDRAYMAMKTLSDTDIEEYLSSLSEKNLLSSGIYQIEDIGIRLFQEIKGDYFTIMGIPLIPLVQYVEKNKHLCIK
jgi:septum formation protein